MFLKFQQVNDIYNENDAKTSHAFIDEGFATHASLIFD